MVKDVSIRSMIDDDRPAIAEIVNTLKEWFDATARERSIPVDLRYQQGFVALVGSQTVGFVTGYVADGRLNIGWLGVRRDWQRCGIGGLLLASIEKLALERGIPEVATYTLGESIDYPPYQLTRQFYAKHGFKVYQHNRTDNPSCPEEIRLKKPVQSSDAAI